MGLRAWWQQRAYKERLDSLLAQYPDVHPWVVEGLLNPIVAVKASASKTIEEHERRKFEEGRLRIIIREELAAPV